MIKRKNSPKNLRTKFGYDPILAMQKDDELEVPEGQFVLEDATWLVASEGVELIRPILKAGKEPGLSGALYVFSELTAKKAALLVNDVIPHIEPHKPWARWHLIEGLQWHTQSLSDVENVAFLRYCEDHELSVRLNISQAIAVMPLEKLEGARLIFEGCPARDYHLEGINLQFKPFSMSAVNTALAKENDVLNCYVFAALYREACRKHYHELPQALPESNREYLEGMIASKKRMNDSKIRRPIFKY